MNDRFHRFLVGIGLAFAVVIGLQWSWNTVAPLFNAPTLAFRHATAGLALLAIAAAVLRTGRRPDCRKRRGSHEA